MSHFRLTKKAKADLKSIAHHTESAWGRDQRNKYLTQLDNCFHTLAREPLLGRACDYIFKGYRKYNTGRHLIFYHRINNDIEIVRILHDSMDVETHLTET